MTNKLTIKQITEALASFGCKSFDLDAATPCTQILGTNTGIVQAVTSLIEAATLDANIECGKAIERQKYWRNRSVEASAELSEAWGDYAAMRAERDELRQQLAAAQNDVKQLRQSRDKRAGQSVVSALKIEVDTSELKTEMQRIGEGLMQAGKTFTGINSPQSAADKADNDGWIAWQSIVWGDCPVEPGTPVIVRYRDGVVSGVLEAMKPLEGVQRDASVSYWHQHGFDNDIVAYKLATKAADNDGWVEWHGGECPVLNGVRVDVQYRCGESARNVPANMSADAGEACWLKRGYMYDIIAYRLAK